MKKYIVKSLILYLILARCAWADFIPTLFYNVETTNTLREYSTKTMQATSLDTQWRFTEGGSPLDFSTADLIKYVFEPDDESWSQAITGSVVSATNGTVKVSFTPSNCNTSGVYNFSLTVQTGANVVMGRAEGELILDRKAGSGITNAFPAASQIGAVAYWDGSDWAKLDAGTSNYVFTTLGAGVAPAWVNPVSLSTNANQINANFSPTNYSVAGPSVAENFAGVDVQLGNLVVTSANNTAAIDANTTLIGTTSNDLTTLYTASDTVVSNGVTSAYVAADTVVSNGVVAGYGAADTVVSNGVTGAYVAADTVVSNGLQAQVDVLETNVFKISANNTAAAGTTNTFADIRATGNATISGDLNVSSNINAGTYADGHLVITNVPAAGFDYVKLYYKGGNQELHLGTNYMGVGDGDVFTPLNDGSANLGEPGYQWGALYVQTNIVSGDESIGGDLNVASNVVGKAVLENSTNILSVANSKIANVVEDTTPQLGGDLDGLNNDLTNNATIGINTGGLHFATMGVGKYLGTNGVYWSRNGTNYWVSFGTTD